MKTLKSQRGQAMSEFIAAMALFVPLILGVIYIGKYSDIKHQAIQASRYAAMERALDPRQHEDNGVIRDETVARFFRDGSQHDIGRNDKADGQTVTDENPNWSQTDGSPLIAKYDDIKVDFDTPAIAEGKLAPMDGVATAQFNNLNPDFGVRANVTVPVVNMTNSGPLASLMNNLNIKVGATTVMAGDPWNGQGSENVANHQTVLSVPARVGSLVNEIPGLDQMFKLLVDTGLPHLGCVKPDVVPGYAATNSNYDPTDDPDNFSNPNDECFE